MLLRGMESGSLLVRGMACYGVPVAPVVPERQRVFAGPGFGGGGEYITEWPVKIPEAGVDTDAFFLSVESLKRCFRKEARRIRLAKNVGDVLSEIRESKPKRDTLDEVFEYLGDPKDQNSRFQKIRGYIFLGGSAWSAWRMLKLFRKKASGV